MQTDINYTMDKLTGLAALFGPEGVTGNRSLSVEAANGICMILEDCARDLDQINRQHEKEVYDHIEENRKLNDRITELQGGAHG